MIWVIWILGVALVLLAVISLYAASEIVRIPYLAVPYRPKDFGLSCEEVSFSSYDGLRLTGWFVAAQKPSPVTLIIMHGLGSNAGDMLLNTRRLAEEGKQNLFYFN